MGCGKSSIGKIVAAQTGKKFIDLDDEIQRTHDQSVSDIFEKNGETYFRKIENRQLKKISLEKNSVIATGGGTPCFFNNMALINSTGISIYLSVLPSLLALRLKQNAHSRPLLKNSDTENLQDEIEKLLNTRKPFYEMANITIDASPTESVIVKKILELL